MPILYDFHMHSSFSTDSSSSMEEMVLRSAALSLKGICFTEHMDADYPHVPGSFEASPKDELEEIRRLQKSFDPRFADLNEIRKNPGSTGTVSDCAGKPVTVSDCNVEPGSVSGCGIGPGAGSDCKGEPVAVSEYAGRKPLLIKDSPDRRARTNNSQKDSLSSEGEWKFVLSDSSTDADRKGAVRIYYGMELGMQPHLADRFQKLAAEWPFDFLNISQHLVGGADPYFPYVWEGFSIDEMIHNYYEEMFSNLQIMGEWDSLSHLDYIIRYIPNRGSLVYDSLSKHKELVAAILEHVISRDKCLEVNTAGFKYGLNQPHPSAGTLKLYKDLGGKHITIGSDAHAPEHIGIAFDKTEKILKSLGFNSYCIFENRKAREIPF